MANPNRQYQYDGVWYDANSDMGKELAKWEGPHPVKLFPQMLYKAKMRPDGIVSVAEVHDHLFATPGKPAVDGAAERFSESCTKVVPDEAARQVAFEQGWRATMQEALDLMRSKHHNISVLAAERARSESVMSEPAQREAAAADAASPDHVAVIEEKPIRRPGRPRKSVAAPAN